MEMDGPWGCTERDEGGGMEGRGVKEKDEDARGRAGPM